MYQSSMMRQVLSRLPSSVVDAVLEKTDLSGYFPHRVTKEDEPFDDYRGYMLVSESISQTVSRITVQLVKSSPFDDYRGYMLVSKSVSEFDYRSMIIGSVLKYLFIFLINYVRNMTFIYSFCRFHVNSSISIRLFSYPDNYSVKE